MKLLFDTRGNEKQKQCAEMWVNPDVSDIVYGGSKGSAKSYTGVSLIFGDAFIYPETHYFIARKKLNDLRRFTIPSIHEVFSHWGVTSSYYSYNGQDNVFNLHNGSKVFLLDAKPLPSDPNYYRFGSMQMTRGWIEEAGEFELEAKNNLHASIGRKNNDKYNLSGKILQTCNPSKNYLYKYYYKPHKIGDLDKRIRFIQALPSDNKMLDKGYLENLERILSKNEKKRLLFGDWEYDDSPDALCDYDSILAIFHNDHNIVEKPSHITADIARLGSDKAVIMVWAGWTVLEVMTFAKSRITDIQNAINALQTKYNIPKRYVVADEDGVGGGLVDNLKIKGFVNNSKAAGKENYTNLQSQCCYKLAEKINSSELYIKADLSDKFQEEIIEELEQLKSYDSDKDGKIKILPKEKIKEFIGRSPDFRDTLMMRAYFDVFKPNLITSI